MELNDLLQRKAIEPNEVLVLRHRPTEPNLRKILPWLASENPLGFNFYQQTQTSRVESQMQKASFVASFIGHEAGKAIFIGLYQIRGFRQITRAALDKVPAQRELLKYGMDTGDRKVQLLFDLAQIEPYADWKGKLIVRWPPPERSWSRWAANNHFEVDAILEESILHARMPDWRELVLSWDELHVIPRKWREFLEASRGIYYILDVTDGKGYVGSAYGIDNILGRWLNYAKTGHGGNKLLRKRKARNLRFSILERVSPDLEVAEIIKRENTWKIRLQTRQFGLNEN